MKKVLVVSTAEHPEAVLRSHLGQADGVKVVVPVVRQGVLDWLANDEAAFARAEDVAEGIAAELPGKSGETAAGEAGVSLAIRDALATFAADEIVVAVRPDAEQGLAESVATANSLRNVFEGIPVRFLTLPD